MFDGEEVNFTEKRAVLHTLLRDEEVINCFMTENEEIKEEIKEENKKMVYEELKKIKEFCDKIHSGKIKGATSKKFKYIVNIGIGGSDLGPKSVCEALEAFRIPHIRSYFVSNVDPMELHHVLTRVKAEETLFIVVSKTFTTQETMCNAKLALNLVSKLMKKSEKIVSDKHFIAVSSNLEEVSAFGIKNVFSMWDFVGGRFSLWSAAGISIALYLGFDNFLRMLHGASLMDKHFRMNILKSSCTMHSLMEVYYTKEGYDTKCIVPYDYYLRNFYLHLQQLDMESNGKSATKKGTFSEKSGMIVWGGVGTNSQHSFFQLLHQGPHKILSEFIYVLHPEKEYFTEGSHHNKLIGNCIAQTEALRLGQKADDPHKHFPGNRPSITIRISKLCPETVGALIAHYEHKVLISGIFYDINSFDQFGVALGKSVANRIIDTIESGEMPKEGECHCSKSSRFLVEEIIKRRKE